MSATGRGTKCFHLCMLLLEKNQELLCWDDESKYDRLPICLSEKNAIVDEIFLLLSEKVMTNMDLLSGCI